MLSFKADLGVTHSQLLSLSFVVHHELLDARCILLHQRTGEDSDKNPCS